MTDLCWMERALWLAERAGEAGEVPVGAVVVLQGEVIGEGWNQPITSSDPTAHAEIVALRAAANRLGNYRLPDCDIYVSLEPCAMCAGAMVHARVKRLIFAASEPRAGAVCSHLQLLDSPFLNHKVSWQGGLCAERSAVLLQDFFRRKREKRSE